MKWRVAAGVLAVMFVFFAALQYNDPDPVQWMAIYLAAAAAAAMTAAGRARWQVPTLVAAASLVWAVSLVPAAAAHRPSWEHLTTWKMMDPEVEESRELGGLTIVLGCMVALAVSARRRSG